MSRSLDIEVIPRLAGVGADEWAQLFGDHPDSFELIQLIDSCGMDGFGFRSIVVRDAGRAIMLAPLFETVFDLSTMLDGMLARAVRMAGQLLPSLLRPRMLGLGFPEGEWGEVGIARGLTAETRACAWDLIVEAIERLRQRRRANLVLCLNFTPRAVRGMSMPAAARFSSIQTYPCARLHLPYRSVEQYLASLSKSARRDLRRKMRSADQLTIQRTTDPARWLDRFVELYEATVDRAEMSLGRHRRAFFQQVCDQVPGAEFVLYFLGTRLVAFNLLVVTPELCVDKYFCMEQPVGREHNLYFVSWMENVRRCIAEGIGIYHAGPGAEATKARLGATFVSSTTLFRHASPIANAGMRWMRGLVSYRPAVEIPDEGAADLTPPAVMPAMEGPVP